MSSFFSNNSFKKILRLQAAGPRELSEIVSSYVSLIHERSLTVYKMKSSLAIGVIPARFASQRFPGKPLAKIGSKTMLEWVYLTAAKSRWLEKILIATDDARIFRVAESFRAPVVMTGSDYSSGTERIASLGAHFSDYELIVNIQCDEPSIDPEVIDRVIEGKMKNPEWAVATAAYPAESGEEKNVHRVKVVFNRKQEALYFSRSPIPFHRESEEREDRPKSDVVPADYYIHSGIYVFEKDFLLRWPSLPSSSLEKKERLEQLRVLDYGEKIGIIVVGKCDPSVDTPKDLETIVSMFRERGVVGSRL